MLLLPLLPWPLLLLLLTPRMLLGCAWCVGGGQLHALQRGEAADGLTPALLLLLLLYILHRHLLLQTRVLLLLLVLPSWWRPHAVPSLRRHDRHALLPCLLLWLLWLLRVIAGTWLQLLLLHSHSSLLLLLLLLFGSCLD